jgi:hypothetical protein
MALNSLLDSPFLLHQPFGRCLRINFHLHPEQGEDRPRLQVTSGAQLKNDLTIMEPSRRHPKHCEAIQAQAILAPERDVLRKWR